jgi:hypothetical protein
MGRVHVCRQNCGSHSTQGRDSLGENHACL